MRLGKSQRNFVVGAIWGAIGTAFFAAWYAIASSLSTDVDLVDVLQAYLFMVPFVSGIAGFFNWLWKLP